MARADAERQGGREGGGAENAPMDDMLKDDKLKDAKLQQQRDRDDARPDRSRVVPPPAPGPTGPCRSAAACSGIVPALLS